MARALRVAVLFLALVVAGVSYLLVTERRTASLATEGARAEIEASLDQRTGEAVSVICPQQSVPARAGYIFDCVAATGSGRLVVRVTEDDSRGHVSWLVTDQPAPAENATD